ncbi:MAG: TatD family deoxyribonuclease, partial [Thermoproteota archaeon]
MGAPRLVDAHCHLHEYGFEEAVRIAGEMVVVAVSDDADSSLETLSISRALDSVVPCVGIHPWEVGPDSLREAERVCSLALESGAPCLGEVGLDRRFRASTFNRQVEVFRVFVDLAREHDLSLNVHAAGAWREVYEMVRGVERVLFHWYTGPLDLLDLIVDSGFFVSVNPSVEVQERQRRVLERVPLENLLTESDGPYRYRGLELSPWLIPRVVRAVAEVKGVSPGEVVEAVYGNLRRFL